MLHSGRVSRWHLSGGYTVNCFLYLAGNRLLYYMPRCFSITLIWTIRKLQSALLPEVMHFLNYEGEAKYITACILYKEWRTSNRRQTHSHTQAAKDVCETYRAPNVALAFLKFNTDTTGARQHMTSALLLYLNTCAITKSNSPHNAKHTWYSPHLINTQQILLFLPKTFLSWDQAPEQTVVTHCIYITL